MRSPLALVVLLSLSPAVHAAPGPVPAVAAPDLQADWRRDGVDDRVKQALTGQGWRFEDDGRALDPKTKAPATQALLKKTILDLRQDARRAALEAVNVMLASGKPTEAKDLERIRTLANELPPAIVSALLDPKSDINAIKAMSSAELVRASAYFDGSRSLADRQAAAQPVSASAAGPRVDLPYHTTAEKAVGEKLRTASEKVIGADPFGKTVLARLDGKPKRPDLPPIVIEDQSGSSVAQYDIRRQAIVLDRQGIMDSVVGTVPPQQRVALRQSISTRAALLAYLDTHPDAILAVAKDHDVVMVHELTHAWQDRREPVFREMARGNLPDIQPLEYEEEAYKTKNYYIQSKLKNDPASVKLDAEFKDYISMTHSGPAWWEAKVIDLRDASPSRALPLRSAGAIELERYERAKARAVATSEDQQSKALDLQILTRGQAQIAALAPAQSKRIAAVDADIEKGRPERYKLLGSYYLVQGLHAERSTDRIALLDQAARYAKVSGSPTLVEEVRKAREAKP